MAAIGIEFIVSKFVTRLMLATEVSPEDRPILAKFVTPAVVNGKSPFDSVINAIWPFATNPVLYAIHLSATKKADCVGMVTAVVHIAVIFDDVALWFTLKPPLMTTFLNMVPPVGRACGIFAIDIGLSS